MSRSLAPLTTSLRVKLALSYLAVTLGAILILTFAVLLAVQNYLRSAQLDRLRERSLYWAQYIEYVYQRQGGGWNNNSLIRILPNDPALIVVADAHGNQILCSQPASLVDSNCADDDVRQGLSQALQGGEVDGSFTVATRNTRVSSLYVAMPLRAGGQTFGSVFVSEPQLYPSNDFLNQVNQAIVFAGAVVALIAVLFSLLLARRLTRPLTSLTNAAEQMKLGKYTQRVPQPRSQDELGLLALTFNEMADTIEADVNELRRQEQALRDLLANIAHDLATPLTAIQGLSEALADDIISEPSARQETAQRIGREVQRLRRMVAELQQMSQLESGHTQLDLAPLDLHSLVDETLAVIAPECEQQSIRVHNEISPKTSAVLADSDRITQALLNLLDNARRHTPAEGDICVGATPEGKQLRIWVRDTGSGIDSADLPHVFERFYRADRSRTGATGGSGLGLSIVKAIVTAHGGSVSAESSPGHGTCISFTLPLSV